MTSKTAQPPLPYETLREITTENCDTVFADVSHYDHSKTESWNTAIINRILTLLVERTTPKSSENATAPAQPHYKYVVNSTIIQHRSTTAASVTNGAGKEIEGTMTETGGRRGMHSAAGAFWDNENDGMWSFKYEAAERKGLDVIVGIVWIRVD